MSTEARQYVGYWWLPQNPDNPVSGSLSVHQREGIELRAVGTLVPMSTLINAEKDSLSRLIVLGQTVGGKSISLLYTTPGEHKGHPFSSRASTSVYNASIAIIGSRHFSSEEEVLFKAIDAKFDLLNQWLGESGIKRVPDEVDDRGCLIKMVIEYTFPEVVEFDIASIEAKFRTNYNCNLASPTSFHYQIKHTSSFVLSPYSPQGLDWYSEKFESLRRFLIVMTGFTLNIGELTEYIDFENDSIGENLQREPHHIHIRIGKGFKEAEEKHPARLLLPLFRTSTKLRD